MQVADVMSELLEQVKVEHLPREKNDQGVENANTWPNQEWFQHYACLYIKYIDIYKKLEEAYDQLVHPQKRIFIRPILESTIARLCEIKKELVFFNTRPKSDYIHLDDLLVDLKYDPNILEIPVPRYFKEDDRIPIDIVFSEKDGKESESAKKNDDDDDEKKVKPPGMTLDEKKQLLDNLLEQYAGTKEVEEEIIADPFTLDMDFVSAVRLIQKNERGRQYRARILKAYQKRKLDIQKDELQKKLKEGISTDLTRDQVEGEAVVNIQKYLRAYTARLRVEEMRQEELVFLGMAPKPKTIQEKLNDPVKKRKEIELRRKNIQQENRDVYEEAKEQLKEVIMDNERPDIEEDMLTKRRHWMLAYRELHENQPPESVKEFYQQELEVMLTPEEEEKKKLEEEEEARNAKKKKGKKDEKKSKEKKKGKKAADDEPEDPSKNLVWTGPSEIVRKFEEFHNKYNEEWANKDESENFSQQYDSDMTKKDVLPEVEEEIRQVVDKMIEAELENYKIMLGMKKKKKKKPKKKKRRRERKEKSYLDGNQLKRKTPKDF